jgi:NAD(P)-dependent dehydrogenase (short-subunit alcohol dehydrogenase family)
MTGLHIHTLAGKRVLVTGSQRGLGLALVDALLDRGALVYAGHRSPDGIPSALDRPGVIPVYLPLDGERTASLPDVDYVVNNAGVNCNVSFDAIGAVEALRAELEVNVLGTLAVVSGYLASGRRPAGFVNIISALAFEPNYFCSTYSASKAALHSLCVSLRDFGAQHGAYVLNAYPTAIDTRLTAGMPIPKLATADVAERVVQAWEDGRDELRFH